MNKIDEAHAIPEDKITEKFEVSSEKGLNKEEVEKRRNKYGKNILAEQEEKSLFKLFIDQVNTPVSYLLFAAAVLSLILGDIPEGVAIIIVLIVNALIGFGMEYQARKSIKSLKKMDKLEATVIREGEEETIDAEMLVPGDIVTLKEGDIVPADMRLLGAMELQINESALTGESVPVSKDTEEMEENTELADRINMAFKGTSVSKGKGKGIIVSTGMDTELGNISEMVSQAGKDEIPLNQKLNSLTKKLIWLILGLAALMAVIGYFTGQSLYDVVQIAIAWSIAAIPEGLPIVASIALAKGMLRLAKSDVLVKKLAAVETLGESNTIFTDKTGTLTENRLTVSRIFTFEDEVKIDWKGGKVANDIESLPFIEKLLQVMTLCNSANYNTENEEESTGDPLEISLLKFSHNLDEKKYKQLRDKELIAEDPFDSDTMRMGTVHEDENGYLLCVKGALGALLELTDSIELEGGKKDFTEERKEKIREKNDAMASKGLRTLAFGYTYIDEKIDSDDFLDEYKITLLGLTGFVDPPQEEVIDAIDSCHEAGINVVMVTGDHAETAKHIAREVHVTNSEDTKVLSGKELKEDGEWSEDIRVFSRVDPEQKLKIVEQSQDKGKIVAMTGDGVNDAPALKKADIGIAMGEKGTQVAKEVADMILKKDNFASIVKAIREGRIIFSNIRKFIIYQLSYHFSEILLIATVSFSIFELALLPLQLLFLNILLDVFPALALGLGKGRKEVMKAKPKDPEEPIMAKKHWVEIFSYGIILGLSASAAYFYSYFRNDMSPEYCNTIAFFTLSLAQLLHTFSMRDDDEKAIFNQVTRNKYVYMAIAFCVVVFGVTYALPQFREVLKLEILSLSQWIIVGIAGVGSFVLVQVLKGLRSKLGIKKAAF